MKTYLGLSLLLSALLLIGCDPANTSDDGSQEPTDSMTETDDSKTPASSPVDVSLEVKSWGEVQQWVESNKGKVVVVDIWSTMCLPCMKEFPNFVDMHERLQDRVVCASLSVDYYGAPEGVTDDITERVKSFLDEKRSTMANFVCSDPDEKVLQELSAVSIPISLVYDAEGNLHKIFTEDSSQQQATKFTYKENVEPLVLELLGDQ